MGFNSAFEGLIGRIHCKPHNKGKETGAVGINKFSVTYTCGPFVR